MRKLLLLLAVMPAIALSQDAGEWQVSLLRSNTTQQVVTGPTQDQAWVACQGLIPATATADQTWKCQTPRYVRVVRKAPPAPVPVNCVVSAWSAWTYSPWVVSGNTETRTGTRFRSVTIPASNGGTACPALTELVTESRPYTPTEPPPVAGVLYTDLARAPACAKVTQYLANGTKRVVTPAEAGIPIIEGRCIEVTPATIKAAVANWQAGDVYYLRAGTYSGVIKSDNWNFSSNFDLIQSPATTDRPIAIVGYPGEVATLDGAGSRPNFIFANSGGGLKANNMVVANLKLIASGICVDSGANVTSENSGGGNLRIVGNTCTITTTGHTGAGMMNFGGSGSTILGNTFVDNPARQWINQSHGLYVHAGADNVTVGYNVFRNLNVGHVIQVHQDGVARDYMNIRIHDNLLEGGPGFRMRGVTASNVSSASTITFERNVFRNVGDGFSCISVYGGIVTLKDNLIYGCNAFSLTTDGFALGSSGSQQRRITATGNRFDSNGAALFQTARGATMAEITFSGNMYCGQPAPSQDASPKSCQ